MTRCPTANNGEETTEERTQCDSYMIDHPSSHQQCEKHLTDLQDRIRCLKKTARLSNFVLLSFATLTILAYFYTPLFNGVKFHDAELSCANAETNLHAYKSCSAYCARENGTVAPDPPCGPLADIVSPERTVELEGFCSREALSSTEGGGAGTGECRKRCKISECCWKDGLRGCAKEEGRMCEVYLPCAILHVDVREFGIGIGPVIYGGAENMDGP